MPSLQYVCPLGGAAHVPTVFPAAIVQVAEQQSVDFEQTSPDWMHHEEPS
jgi:hypothetical protein